VSISVDCRIAWTFDGSALHRAPVDRHQVFHDVPLLDVYYFWSVDSV
jgi:hypothetical protein